MIHYHGTPVGGSRQDAARFLAGRHALVPFPRKDDLGAVAETCQSFVFDNGAFSVWKKGGTLDVDGYIRWADDWHRHPGFDWALIPDVIEGDEEANDRLLEDWPAHLPGAPVWHMHESLGRLQRLCREWRTVALGSSGDWPTPGANRWWERMTLAMDAICDQDGRPPCRLHGLRMMSPKVFPYLGIRRQHQRRRERGVRVPLRLLPPPYPSPTCRRHRRTHREPQQRRGVDGGPDRSS